VSQADIMKIVFDKLDGETQRLSLIFAGKISNTSLWHLFSQSWYFATVIYCSAKTLESQEVFIVSMMTK